MILKLLPSGCKRTARSEAQLASNGIDCGTPAGFESERAKELLTGINEWRLLWRRDLAAQRFEKCWLRTEPQTQQRFSGPRAGLELVGP